MRKIFYPVAAALALTTAACNTPADKAELSAGIQLSNMDTTACPGQDFFQYACGGWMKNNPLPDAYGRYGSFDMLGENNKKQMKDMILDIAASKEPQSEIATKIASLYNIAIDSVKLNNDGCAPIKPVLEGIDAIKSNEELIAAVADMTKKGYGPYFAVGVNIDEKNSSMNIVQTYQSGLTLGNRDYYIKNDEYNTTLRSQLKTHIENLFKLTGATEEAATKAAADVMEVETAQATAHFDNLKLRDPYSNYHKMNMEELNKTLPEIDWNEYLGMLGLNNIAEINISQVEPVKCALDLMSKGNLETQKSYLKWKVIKAAAPMLSDDFVNENFNFDGKIVSGLSEMQPRWKRAISSVNGMLGMPVGQMYVERYFPAEAKARMIELIDNLKTALGERIQENTWMSDVTKEKALEKLSKFYVKVGYPDAWRDYSGLAIENDSYFANAIRSNEFEYAYMISKAGKPADKTEWMMTPQTVNAYYNPTTNEICFPAGILQYPFFDMNADDAFNYGAIGVVIGHEMTHGFDDQGRLYDKDGNLNEWWTKEDAEKFKERAKILSDYFSAQEVLPGLHANGELTLGENIADHGGLQVAFRAFQNATAANALPVKEGFTPEQRFFIAYANLWAANIRDEEIRNRTLLDVHALGELRVNAALVHIENWYKAFGITENDSLYLAPEKRASIW